MNIKKPLSPLVSQIICFVCVVTLSVPFPLIAQAAPSKRKTALLVPVGADSQRLNSNQNKVLAALQQKLKRKARFLPIKDVAQLAKIQSQHKNDPKLEQAIHLMNDSLDSYAEYQRNATQTITAMNSVESFLLNDVSPSSQAADLMLSAKMTKAWLLHKSKQKDLATAELKNLLEISNKADLKVQNYPPKFRRFLKQVKSDSSTHKASIRSTPPAANVYVNHVFVGVSPLSITLPQGQYKVGFSASGRKSVQKKLDLRRSHHKTVTANLSWESSNHKKASLPLTKWNQLKPAKKIALAHQIASAAQAEQAVFFEFSKTAAGTVPKATLYDARYSQLMKVITYPKAVTNLQTEQAAITQYFSKKISPYLGNNNVHYWTKNIDKSFILDHGIANKGKKPIYKQPALWAGLGLIAAGTITAVILSMGSDSSTPATGGVSVGFGDL